MIIFENRLTDFDHFLRASRSYVIVVKSAGAWWRHQMETFSASLAICAGNSPVPGEFPAQRPVTRSLDVSFDLRLNKQLSKQSWGWWFETPSRPLWSHSNENDIKSHSFLDPGTPTWYIPSLVDTRRYMASWGLCYGKLRLFSCKTSRLSTDFTRLHLELITFPDPQCI